MTDEKLMKARLRKIAPWYFRSGVPKISSIKSKKLKKAIINEVKRRRILEIQYKFKNKKFKNLTKKNLKELEKILKTPLHSSRTKKRRLSKKRRTRKLSKK